MKLNFTTLDAFSSTRFAGNPVAVIQVPASAKAALTQTQKQAIASEFNLPEIVFLHLPEDLSSSERTIDIFTVKAEVPFAGHPTIGTSHYLLKTTNQDHVKTVVTKAGKIPIWIDDSTGNVKVDVPFAYHHHAVTWTCPLNEIQNPTCSIVNGMTFIYVELPDLETLAKADTSGNLRGFSQTYDPTPLDEGWRNGLIGTMYFVSQGIDSVGRKKYRTRMFGSVGREDPGTGSASSGLGCYLALRDGEGRFVFEQGVEMGRRNIIEVEVKVGAQGEVEKVLLSGEAAEVMEGTLEV